VSLVGQCKPCNCSRHPDGLRTLTTAGDHLPKDFCRQSLGRIFTEVDCLDLVPDAQDQKSTTTNIPCTGMGHRQSKCCRDCSVHCVASGFENLDARLGGRVFDTRDHAELALYGNTFSPSGNELARWKIE